tara:strand:- start:7965 stop:9494 length:1530 start_codon:yes stop_codon:yes gene_type:complete
MDLSTLTGVQKDRLLSLPRDEQVKIIDLLDELNVAKKRSSASSSFIDFVHAVWPAFISGRHHKIMAKAFDRIVSGDLKRLIINMPPRHTKSEFASYHLPAYYLGHHPDRKIIQTSHTADLSVGFGRKVRDLVADPDYRDIFPETSLKADSKAAGRWATSRKGEYFAIGVGGAVTGKGSDLLIIDDPHSEQEGQQAMSDPKVFDKVYEWYTSGPRQRLQPGAAIVVVMTRWGSKDLTGRLLEAQAKRGGKEQWEVIEFPAILPSETSLWPEYWSIEELEALREELPNSKWMAQYQQNPTSEEGAILKREWWQIWESARPPECDFIIQTWDTAFLKTETSDFSACTTWGVFYKANDKGQMAPNMILLSAFKERMEFPDLKKKAYQLYMDEKPDAFIVEGKASGMPLIFELRAMGIPVQDFVPSRGKRGAPNDKIARANAVSDLFASGIIWRPATRWAEEVADECGSFPLGDHDDYVDATVMACMRFRHGGFIVLDSDEDQEEKLPRMADYY